MQGIEARLFDPELRLENETVILRVVSMQDLPALEAIAFDPAIWTWFTSVISNPAELEAYVAGALAEFSNKQKVPFVIIEKSSGRLAGMSSFGNISIRDERIEIGWSWLAPAVQGTGINQSYKWLLMDFVFGQLHFKRLEFKTDVLNAKARKALIKIGTTEEGILRSHTLMPHNRRRDTIYYSILHHEWNLLRSKA